MSHLHFGFLDWTARQTNPSTATGEYLAMWGALVRVYRKPATAATGVSVPITGTAGATAEAGAVLNRGDGYQYRLDADVTLGSAGTGTGSITAVLPDASADSTGGGASGNAAAGTSLTFDVAVEGINSGVTLTTAVTGGTDIEGEEAFRSRVLEAFQNTPQGGSDADYKKWALAVPGVTRVWVVRRLMGAGTVGVYVMLDGNTGSNDGGFPVGKVWPRETGTVQAAVLNAVASEHQKSDTEAFFLLEGAFPATATIMLPEWEASLGLPDDCAIGETDSIALRQKAVVSRLTATGGQSVAYFTEQARALGYAVTVTQFRQARAGLSAAGAALNGDDWPFVMLVTGPETTITCAQTGVNYAGDPLRSWGNKLLECRLLTLAPSHIIVKFVYTNTTG